LSILLKAFEGWAQDNAAVERFKGLAEKELERLEAVREQVQLGQQQEGQGGVQRQGLGQRQAR
jgi:hypothetical protein